MGPEEMSLPTYSDERGPSGASGMMIPAMVGARIIQP